MKRTRPQFTDAAKEKAAASRRLAFYEQERLAQARIKVGDVLRHRDRRGNVVSTCTYVGPREWVLEDGRKFTSLTAAASADAAARGKKAASQSGWVYWGLECQEREYRFRLP